MSNAKKQNKILIILVLTVCAVALAVSVVTPVSGAKYVKTIEDTSVSIKVTEIPTTTLAPVSEGVEWIINEFLRYYNPNNNNMVTDKPGKDKYFYEWSYLRYYTVVNKNMATSTLDSTGGNWGMRISQQLAANKTNSTLAVALQNPVDFSYCISIDNRSKVVTIYFVNKYINNLAITNRVENVYECSFEYSGNNVTNFKIENIITEYSVGTMEIASKGLDNSLMTYLKVGTFEAVGDTKTLTATLGTKTYSYEDGTQVENVPYYTLTAVGD